MTRLILLFSAAAALLTGATASAQSGLETEPAPPGWSVTPSLAISHAWDDNVLFQGQGAAPSDAVSVVRPSGELRYNGKRSLLSAGYDGAFEMYRQFDSLNNYGQQGRVNARHLITPHTTIFARQAVSFSPTTDLVAIAGVPFLRLGARVIDLREGVEHAFSKRTTLEASYDFQWIRFDKDPAAGRVLEGGTGHGGSAALRHHLSERTTLTADYGLQHATIVDSSVMTVQTALVGVERRFSEHLTAFAAFGGARLDTNEFAEPRTAASWHAGVTRDFRRVRIGASYDRTFIPAFGVGGTLQEDAFQSHVAVPLGRRLYANGSFAWRQDTPLSNIPATLGTLSLHSRWIGAAVGYAISPWLHVETFYDGAHQNIERPGGLMDRNRAGFEIVTLKPLRIR